MMPPTPTSASSGIGTKALAAASFERGLEVAAELRGDEDAALYQFGSETQASSC